MVKLPLATITGIFILGSTFYLNAYAAADIASATPTAEISSTTFSNLNSALDAIQSAVLNLKRAIEIVERAINIIRRIGALAKHFFDIASDAALKAARVLNVWFEKATGITVPQFGAGLWHIGVRLFDYVFEVMERLLSRTGA